jgi:predicted transcriptional regulator
MEATQVNIRLEPDLARKLDALARQTRRKRTDVMRRLLDLAHVQGSDLALGAPRVEVKRP